MIFFIYLIGFASGVLGQCPLGWTNEYQTEYSVPCAFNLRASKPGAAFSAPLRVSLSQFTPDLLQFNITTIRPLSSSRAGFECVAKIGAYVFGFEENKFGYRLTNTKAIAPPTLLSPEINWGTPGSLYLLAVRFETVQFSSTVVNDDDTLITVAVYNFDSGSRQLSAFSPGMQVTATRPFDFTALHESVFPMSLVAPPAILFQLPTFEVCEFSIESSVVQVDLKIEAFRDESEQLLASGSFNWENSKQVAAPMTLAIPTLFRSGDIKPPSSATINDQIPEKMPSPTPRARIPAMPSVGGTDNVIVPLAVGGGLILLICVAAICFFASKRNKQQFERGESMAGNTIAMNYSDAPPEADYVRPGAPQQIYSGGETDYTQPGPPQTLYGEGSSMEIKPKF